MLNRGQISSSLRPLASILIIILIGSLITGCVSRRRYNEDLHLLVDELNRRSFDENQEIQSLRAQVKDKNATLRDLTERYSSLQNAQSDMEGRFNSFRGDLEELSKDVAHLKLVITANSKKMKNPVVNEMLIKIIDMEYKLRNILKKDKIISIGE